MKDLVTGLTATEARSRAAVNPPAPRGVPSQPKDFDFHKVLKELYVYNIHNVYIYIYINVVAPHPLATAHSHFRPLSRASKLGA